MFIAARVAYIRFFTAVRIYDFHIFTVIILTKLLPSLMQGCLNVRLVFAFQAVLRLTSQAALLYQLKFSTPLLSTNTQGFAWIWITIAITFLTKSEKGDLMMPVFAAFWLYGLFIFLPSLFSDLRWI